jgi:acyl-CoA thioester hydrolase
MASMIDGAASKLVDEANVFLVRVYYEDTDSGGIVYYANYFKFAERARTELLRGMGVCHTELMMTDDIAFAVRRCDADFLVPARLDDLLEVYTSIDSVAGASLKMEQTIKRNGDDMVNLRLKLACVTSSGRPARLPTRLRTAFEDFARKQKRHS